MCPQWQRFLKYHVSQSILRPDQIFSWSRASQVETIEFNKCLAARWLPAAYASKLIITSWHCRCQKSIFYVGIFWLAAALLRHKLQHSVRLQRSSHAGSRCRTLWKSTRPTDRQSRAPIPLLKKASKFQRIHTKLSLLLKIWDLSALEDLFQNEFVNSGAAVLTKRQASSAFSTPVAYSILQSRHGLKIEATDKWSATVFHHSLLLDPALAISAGWRLNTMFQHRLIFLNFALCLWRRSCTVMYVFTVPYLFRLAFFFRNRCSSHSSSESFFTGSISLHVPVWL